MEHFQPQSLADHDMQVIAKAINDEKINPWKSAIIEAHVVNHTLSKEHYENPIEALTDLIIYEGQLALDPKVSKQAEDMCMRVAEKVREACADIAEDTLEATWQDYYGRDNNEYGYKSAEAIRNIDLNEVIKDASY